MEDTKSSLQSEFEKKEGGNEKLKEEWQAMTCYEKDKAVAVAMGLNVVEDANKDRRYLFVRENDFAGFCPEFSYNLDDVRQAEEAAIGENISCYTRYLAMACKLENKPSHKMMDMIPMITANADQRAFAVWATLTTL